MSESQREGEGRIEVELIRSLIFLLSGLQEDIAPLAPICRAHLEMLSRPSSHVIVLRLVLGRRRKTNSGRQGSFALLVQI